MIFLNTCYFEKKKGTHSHRRGVCFREIKQKWNWSRFKNPLAIAGKGVKQARYSLMLYGIKSFDKRCKVQNCSS
jgi:hypothetical protein